MTDLFKDNMQSLHSLCTAYMNKISMLEEEIKLLKAERPEKTPIQWNKFDVVEWLTNMGEVYKQYTKLFLDNNITGDILLNTTFSQSDLFKMGVENEFHRKRIIHEVSKLYSPDDMCDH